MVTTARITQTNCIPKYSKIVQERSGLQKNRWSFHKSTSFVLRKQAQYGCALVFCAKFSTFLQKTLLFLDFWAQKRDCEIYSPSRHYLLNSLLLR